MEVQHEIEFVKCPICDDKGYTRMKMGSPNPSAFSNIRSICSCRVETIRLEDLAKVESNIKPNTTDTRLP